MSAPAAAAPRTWTIELPAGMELLSLNDRCHWSTRYKRSQALREAACWLARKERIPPLERAAVVVEYQPPGRSRRRDADNVPAASGKHCIDGIVDARVLPDDDSPEHVASVICRIGEPFPLGRLVLHITEVTR